MKKNEYKKASDLTRLIRNWYAATDNPGIPAAQRIRFLVEMRNFLLKDLDFSKFLLSQDILKEFHVLPLKE